MKRRNLVMVLLLSFSFWALALLLEFLLLRIIRIIPFAQVVFERGYLIHWLHCLSYHSTLYPHLAF